MKTILNFYIIIAIIFLFFTSVTLIIGKRAEREELEKQKVQLQDKIEELENYQSALKLQVWNCEKFGYASIYEK